MVLAPGRLPVLLIPARPGAIMAGAQMRDPAAEFARY